MEDVRDTREQQPEIDVLDSPFDEAKAVAMFVHREVCFLQ